MTQYSQLRGLKLLSLTCAFLLGAWGVPQAAAQTVATPVITSTAVTVGTTTNLAIPPSGITVTVVCETADSIRYTLDGSEPDGTSSLYSAPVFIAEQLGLTDTKTITFKAKGFAAGMTESATASASFLNYSEAEFLMRFQLVGVTDGKAVLTLGFASAAADGMDSTDTAVLNMEPPSADTGIPPLPGIAVRAVTQGRDFLVTDYRSRLKSKEWPLYIDTTISSTNQGAVTLKWGEGAEGLDSQGGSLDFTLPVVPYLHLLIDTDSDGIDDLDFDLTDSSASVRQVTLDKDYSPYLDANQFLTSRCRVVYRNDQGTLKAAIGPLAATQADPPAQWAYRPASGGVFSAWLAADATVTGLHSGDYEVKFSPVTTDPPLYTPPSQIVSVVAGETTTVAATYKEKAAEATMAVSPTYDTATKTVKVDCAFTYTPQVALTQVTWVFDVPEGWTIAAINGLTADWSYEIQLDGRTVIFSYTPTIRGTVSSNSFEFTADLKYGGAGEPDSVLVGVTSVQGAPDGGGDPVDSDPPVAQTSNLRTATLDVNGDTFANFADVLLIYRNLPVPSGGLGYTAAKGNLIPDGVTPPLSAAAIEERIAALAAAGLDVNGDTFANFADVLLIYRNLPVPSGGLGYTAAKGNLIPDGVTPPLSAAVIEQRIHDLYPAR